MIPINTTGDISPRTSGALARKLLEVAQPIMVSQRFGQPDVQEKNASKVRRWRRYETLPPAVAPLAEGITPNGTKVRYTDYQTQLQEFGDVVPLTDVVADTHEDPVLQEMTKRIAQQAAETVEVVTFEVLKGGSNVIFANNVATRLLVTSAIARSDLRIAVRTLKRNRAQKISSIINASPNIGTSPVEAAFFAFAHPDVTADIRGLPGFKNSVEYGAPGKSLPGEIGAAEDVRFIETDFCTPWLAAATSISSTTYLSNGAIPGSGAAPDVYPILILGQDAYGVVRLQGYGNSPKIYVQNPGTSSKSDILGQRGGVGWKLWYSAVRLNELWMERLEVAVTAKPA